MGTGQKNRNRNKAMQPFA